MATDGHAQLITDPFKELLAERRKHEETLKLLDLWMIRSQVRDARGQPTDMRCKLCAHPPAGQNALKFRASCACRLTPSVLGNQRVRLRQKIRQNNSEVVE